MPFSIFSQTFRDLEKPVIVCGLGLAVYSLAALAFYPVLQAYPDFADWFQRLFSSFQAVTGLIDPMTTPAGFLNTTSFALVLPGVLTLFSVLAIHRIFNLEREKGYLDVLLARPVPRWRLALQKLSAVALATGMIAAILWVVHAWRITALELEVDLLKLFWVMVGLVLTSLFFGAVTMTIGTLVQKTPLSKALALIALALAYIFYLAPHLSPAFDFLRLFTPFWYLLGSNPLVNGLNPLHVVVLVLVTAAITAVGLIFFERKDLLA